MEDTLSRSQMWRIKRIQQQVGVTFRGRTAKSATQFIWRFIDLSKQIDEGNVTNHAAWKALSKKEEMLR